MSQSIGAIPKKNAPDKWSLWTGTTQLRGANIHQRRVYMELDGSEFMGPGPLGPPYFQEDFNRLAAWGANYVNISHPGLFTESPPYVLDLDVQNNLDSLVAMIARAHMYSVISCRTGPGRSEFTFLWDEVGDWFDDSYLNDNVWQNQEAQDAWADMWQYTAQRYRNNPTVVGYDLMVEPNSNEVGSHPINDPLDIWDPDEFDSEYGGSLYDWNQFYPQIVTAIREVDPDTPVLIGGNGYSAVDWLQHMEKIDDSRTVYTVHQYQPYVYTHQLPPLSKSYPGIFDADWDDQLDLFNRNWLVQLLSPIDDFKNTYPVPVAVNEFGLMRWEPNAAQYMDDLMELFEERDMNHALWLWEPFWQAHAEEDDFNFRHGPDPGYHTQVDTSDLIGVIKKYWGCNTEFPTSIQNDTHGETPTQFILGQNYPNPFNTITNLPFYITESGLVELKIFNVSGVELQTCIRKDLPPGHHHIPWNGDRFPSGIYIYRLYFQGSTINTQGMISKKCLLLK